MAGNARWWVLLCALSACGGDEETAAVEGLWGIDRPDGCVVLLRIEESGACALGYACELTTGDIGAERHEGTCEVTDGQLVAHWERSTCADHPDAVRSPYTVDSDQLVLEADSGRLVFERLEDDGEGGGSGVVVYGCWDGDTLVFRDLLPLD